MTNKKEWLQLLRWLKRTFPAKYLITIRSRPQEKHGYSDLRQKRFFININSVAQYELRVDAIIHEWAHCLTPGIWEKEEHGKDWGRAYAKIYRAFVKWSEE